MKSTLKELEEQVALKLKEQELLKKLQEIEEDIEQRKTQLQCSGSEIKLPEKVPQSATPIDLTCAIESEKATPPLKKLKQVNLMQSFRLSVSNTNKAGVTTVLSPAIIEDTCSEESAKLQCDKCSYISSTYSNLTRHKVNNCRALQPAESTYRARYAYNRGQHSRKSYTNQQKMAAVLFHNTFTPGQQGIATEYSKISGISVDTIRKWLNTEEARVAIRREWMRDPSSKRGGQRGRGKVAKGQFIAAEERLFQEILLRRDRVYIEDNYWPGAR